MRKIENVVYGADETANVLDVYLPECKKFPVFVYFHGGGIEKGDKARAAIMMEYLAEHGIAVVSANYRMDPSAKSPEFLEDAAQAVAWTRDNIGAYGACTGIYVGGSSAGGYMSMMLCFDARWLGSCGMSPLDVAGWVHDAGQPTAHFNVLKYSGIDDRRVIVDETAPLYHIGTAEEYSPMLFIVSDNDMQNRYEQTMLTLSTLKHFGHTEPTVSFKLMHGKHCAYVKAADENGVSIFGQIIEEYIRSIS